MATNTLLTPSVITNELLMRFKNNLPFVSSISNEYDERFDKIGDTLLLRDSARYVANDGADITSQIQDSVETSKTLTLDGRACTREQIRGGRLDVGLSVGDQHHRHAGHHARNGSGDS